MSIFLVSTASALIVVDGQWKDGGQSIEINEGESASFDVYFTTYDWPMSVEVRMYSLSDSGEELIYTFIDSTTEDNFFQHTYVIDESIYKTDGEFKIIISGSDNEEDSDEAVLELNVVKPVSEEKEEHKTERKRYYYEDEFDRERYLEQFKPKTIPSEDVEGEVEKSVPSNSWIIWLIVGLIVLVVLVIVIISLKR